MRIVINDQKRNELVSWLTVNGECPDWVSGYDCTQFVYLLHFSLSEEYLHNAIALNNSNTICIANQGFGIKVGMRQNPGLESVIRAEHNEGASIGGVGVTCQCLEAITVICCQNNEDLEGVKKYLKSTIKNAIIKYPGAQLIDDNDRNDWFPYTCESPNVIKELFF
ncbi:hypothetical protein OAW23_05225 [Flavobacteriales bacterium]|nr:hypothetical protein [Flavobacteriales bacterium]